MKALFTSILLITVVGLALLGVFGATGHLGVRGHGGACASIAARGVACPAQLDSSAMVLFHIGEYRALSLFARAGETSSLLLSLIAMLFSLGLAFTLAPPSLESPHLAAFRHRSRAFSISPRKRAFARWLALHENSPTFR